MTTRADMVALDEADPLAHHRTRFHLPDQLIYLDGNSLGAQPVVAKDAVATAVDEWRDLLIGGWMEAGWIDLPASVGAKVAAIIGAAPDHVLVCDTVTTNLYKALSAATALRPERGSILIEEGAFPTDRYITASVAERMDRDVRVVPRGSLVADHVDDSVAVAVLQHLDFRTGELFDMQDTTSAVHAAGALAIWDLSHTAGVIPMNLEEADVDFAVGCTYKYLNGGPGAPAYVYASPRHLTEVNQPLPGWLGHADPFQMTEVYEPDAGMRRFMTGTQQIISMRALDASLGVYEGVDIHLVRAKSQSLTDHFIRLVDERCEGLGLEVISPRDPELRGSQVSLRHNDAAEVFPRIVTAGVRGDFRTPDILRFGFAPLYVSHADVWDAVDSIRSVVEANG